MACKLKLKKNRIFYAIARRHLGFVITKKDLKYHYINKKESIRKTAKALKISKNTALYYLKKFSIKLRTKSEAGKLKHEKVWCDGLTKEIDSRLVKSGRKQRQTHEKKRKLRIKEIETKYNLKLKDVLHYLYWGKNMTQEKIAKELNFDRAKIIKLMRKYKIKLRPNYEYIASLKGKEHPLYGKTWEETYGREGAKKRRKFFSKFSRERIIKRIKNNEIPFFNTSIEILMAKEMQKRNIQFTAQFDIDNKFVCDFAIPKVKIIVECDGDYWHSNPKFYDRNKLYKGQIANLKRDKIKDKYLNNKGWKIIRFFESDIKNSVSACVDKLEKEINKFS